MGIMSLFFVVVGLLYCIHINIPTVGLKNVNLMLDYLLYYLFYSILSQYSLTGGVSV